MLPWCDPMLLFPFFADFVQCSPGIAPVTAADGGFFSVLLGYSAEGCSQDWYCPCSVKVLTVQVVLSDTYCSGGTSSTTLTLKPANTNTADSHHLLTSAYAKVHLVQIVK